MTYTETRANLAETMDRVVNDCEEVVITRKGHEPVVMVGLAEYESMKETLHLLGSRKNARRLLDAMDRLDAGEGIYRDLIE